MEPRLSLWLRDNSLAEQGGNMPKGGEETATPSMEIRTRMRSEFPQGQTKGRRIGRTV